MSHFLLGVIIPEDLSDVESYLEMTLEPYDENTEVAPYQRPCRCGERQARRQADAIAAEETGLTWDTLRQSFAQKPEAEQTPKAWERHTKRLREAEARELARLPKTPQADCDYCHGSGTYTSTYNPKSKWDWWQIGGRWDGVLAGTPAENEDGLNFGPNPERLGNNLVRVEDLTRERMPFAFVLPDGTWLQQGEMGGWGIVHREDISPEMWETKTLDALKARYGGLRVVAVDCHI